MIDAGESKIMKWEGVLINLNQIQVTITEPGYEQRTLIFTRLVTQ
jgi:hypothetical protein